MAARLSFQVYSIPHYNSSTITRFLNGELLPRALTLIAMPNRHQLQTLIFLPLNQKPNKKANRVVEHQH